MQSEISYLVSNIDIQKKFHRSKQIKIMVYSDLQGITDLLELVPYDKSACFILLRTSTNAGHWTCICRNLNKIYYFDSYGIKPDGELSNISQSDRYVLGENEPILMNLINSLSGDYTFQYNKIQFQEYSSIVNTCGKWSTVFAMCIFEGLTMDIFQQNMMQLKTKYKVSFDSLICTIWDAF